MADHLTKAEKRTVRERLAFEIRRTLETDLFANVMKGDHFNAPKRDDLIRYVERLAQRVDGGERR